jgi:hypothetical protein
VEKRLATEARYCDLQVTISVYDLKTDETGFVIAD